MFDFRRIFTPLASEYWRVKTSEYTWQYRRRIYVFGFRVVDWQTAWRSSDDA